MSWIILIKRWIIYIFGSPAFWMFVKKFRQPKQNREPRQNSSNVDSRPSVFSGFFNSWNEVENGYPWVGGGWLQKSKEKLEERRTVNNQQSSIVKNLTTNSCFSLPALLINMMTKTSDCRVLDYGGGTGDFYFMIKRKLIELKKVSWCVVDNKEIMKLGESYREGDDNLFFHRTIPCEHKFDIVLITTVIQYVPDYREFLSPVLSLKPKFLLFMRLWAGDFPTDFITSQNIFGAVTPVKLIVFSDFKSYIEGAGYTVRFLGPCSYFEGDRKTEGIPLEYQPTCDVNVIFERVG